VVSRCLPDSCGRGIVFQASALITSGAYAHTRNPLYLANLLLWTGMALLTRQWPVVFAVMGAVALQYRWIILAEERFLADSHGPAYREYCRRVPRFLPQWRRDPEAPPAVACDWKKGLFREHDTMMSVLLGAWCLAASRAGLFPGQAQFGAMESGVWLLAVPAAAWLAIKAVKKSFFAGVRW